MSWYDSPWTTLGVLEEDPKLNPQDPKQNQSWLKFGDLRKGSTPHRSIHSLWMTSIGQAPPDHAPAPDHGPAAQSVGLGLEPCLCNLVWTRLGQRLSTERKLNEMKALTVPNSEEENQVGEIKEQSVSRRTIPQCSTSSANATELEVVEGQCRKAMNQTKGRIAEWIGDPN
uniref:Uncharacterized protein n=1 Tax=Solanum tuberosum TaxID=4113 RepID=M1DL43_SOLTU